MLSMNHRIFLHMSKVCHKKGKGNINRSFRITQFKNYKILRKTVISHAIRLFVGFLECYKNKLPLFHMPGLIFFISYQTGIFTLF